MKRGVKSHLFLLFARLGGLATAPLLRRGRGCWTSASVTLPHLVLNTPASADSVTPLGTVRAEAAQAAYLRSQQEAQLHGAPFLFLIFFLRHTHLLLSLVIRRERTTGKQRYGQHGREKTQYVDSRSLVVAGSGMVVLHFIAFSLGYIEKCPLAVALCLAADSVSLTRFCLQPSPLYTPFPAGQFFLRCLSLDSDLGTGRCPVVCSCHRQPNLSRLSSFDNNTAGPLPHV